MKTSISISRFIGLLAVLCLTGCATGPKFTPVAVIPKDKALIYVYRKFHVGGMISFHRIYANDELVADFANASYEPYFATPGKVVFSSKSESPAPLLDAINSSSHLLTIDAIAGQTYYAEFHIGDTWGPKLILVSQEVGEKRIQKCKLAQ